MALTSDQITAKNFKEFYELIFPYLGGGGGGIRYYDNLEDRPVESDALDMNAVCTPLPDTSGGGVLNSGFNLSYQVNGNLATNEIGNTVTVTKEV